MTTYILANPDNSIQYIGSVNTPNATEFSGVLPPDLLETFALGKYTFVNGAIVEVVGWIPPTPTPPPTPV